MTSTLNEHPDVIKYRRVLDQNWPVARGVEVNRAEARRAAWRMIGELPSSEYDHATHDVIIGNLVQLGLLVVVPTGSVEPHYRRPDVDIDFTASADRAKAQASVVMYNAGGPGDVDIPLADHLAATGAKQAEQAALAAQPKPPTLDERLAAIQAEMAELTAWRASVEAAAAEPKTRRRRGRRAPEGDTRES